jgi:D-serine deaminase-like pyridoxal phosphate-dependent protein
MVCVDDKDNVEQIDRAARAAGVRPRVLIEVDVGMGRAGVQPGAATVELASQISRFESIRFAGLQTWESHTLKITDEAEKKRQVLAALSQLNDTAERIRGAGMPVDILSCGGTGTYWISAFAPGITEIEAGGGIYGCVRYRKSFGVQVEPALTVLSTVTSRPAADRIICDAGFKAAGKGAPDPELMGSGIPYSVSFSAEHGVITLSQEVLQPRVGDTIEFVPGYSDAVIFLHDYLYAIRDGFVETIWPIIGRGKLQ